MKEMYLDIMEKAFLAYTADGIREYIDEVRRDGLTEHGFPRLCANLGILIAHGRKTELMDTFWEMMELCCEEIPRRKAANDFSVREICCCLMLLEQTGTVDSAQLALWKRQLAAFDPWQYYDTCDDLRGGFKGNWVLFAAVSEFVRGQYLGIDTMDFVERQLPSQLANLDQNGMYMDHPPIYNHMVYDLVPRFLMAFLLQAGYRGNYAAQLEQTLDRTAELTLKMQSVTGELAFGGRSNQFIHNEAMLCAYCEMEASRHRQKGNMVKAGEFKAAAKLAAEKMLRDLSRTPISHVKNRYPLSTKIGCEDYAYFNKYMITVASNLYLGILFADEEICPTLAPTLKGGYVISTSEHFHKTFLSAAGYHLEIDTFADPHYDACGLGRVHKADCPSPLCLSMPFAVLPAYVLEAKNHFTAMSLCCYAQKDGRLLLGAERYAWHRLLRSESDAAHAMADFDVRLSPQVSVRQTYRISDSGVELTVSGEVPTGFMVPVFDYDGAEHTTVTVSEQSIRVEYDGSVCTYRFPGGLSRDYQIFYNRNGRYRVYTLAAQRLHITMEATAYGI